MPGGGIKHSDLNGKEKEDNSSRRLYTRENIENYLRRPFCTNLSNIKFKTLSLNILGIYSTEAVWPM